MDALDRQARTAGWLYLLLVIPGPFVLIYLPSKLIVEDIEMAMSLEPETCRLMASEYGSVETFLDKLGIGETGVSTVI